MSWQQRRKKTSCGLHDDFTPPFPFSKEIFQKHLGDEEEACVLPMWMWAMGWELPSLWEVQASPAGLYVISTGDAKGAQLVLCLL